MDGHVVIYLPLAGKAVRIAHCSFPDFLASADFDAEARGPRLDVGLSFSRASGAGLQRIAPFTPEFSQK
jgi:hypothetical protein